MGQLTSPRWTPAQETATTDRGRALCSGYRVQWSDFRGRIDRLILAEGPLETEDDHDKA